MSDIKIRTVTENDAEQLLEIYAPYVEKTAITFEYEVPSVEDFKSRIKRTLKKISVFCCGIGWQNRGICLCRRV